MFLNEEKDKGKGGVIISCPGNEVFQYYSANNDSSRKDIVMPTNGTKISNRAVKTIKMDVPVSIANNNATITMYPDGSFNVQSNAIA